MLGSTSMWGDIKVQGFLTIWIADCIEVSLYLSMGGLYWSGNEWYLLLSLAEFIEED